MTSARKVAFCTVPHIGGIYSVYQKLRTAVTPHGWQILGVQVGDELDRWEYRQDLADQGVCRVEPNDRDLKRTAQRFCQWVEEQAIDIVIPMSSPAALAAIPHLPSSTQVVTRCINANIQAYRLAATNVQHLNRIVFTSPRQREEITTRFRVPASKFVHIPNAVDTNLFCCHPRTDSGDASALSLIYVGRLVNNPKNIFILPKICDELQRLQIPFHLKVIGSGSDSELLRHQMQRFVGTGNVEFLGPLQHASIIHHFQQSDCLLLPSEQEGFPNTLIEAMACGVVPIVSRLKGITDWIVEDQRSGFLCSYDQPSEFVSALSQLYREIDRRDCLSQAARQTVVEHFNIDQFTRNWCHLFEQVIAHPTSRPEPLSWNQFKPCSALERSGFRWLPRKVRQKIRTVLDTFGLPTR